MWYSTEETYADCDQKFVRTFLTPDYLPIWAVDDWKEGNVTRENRRTALLGGKKHYIMPKLFMGLEPNNCIEPCVRTMVKSMKVSEAHLEFKKDLGQNSSTLVMSFSKR